MLNVSYVHRPPTTDGVHCNVAHALQTPKHRPPNKASNLVSRKRNKSTLAPNILPSKNGFLYSHPTAGSSAETLTSSESLKAKEHKAIPQRTPPPIDTDYSSPETPLKSLFTPARVYPIASSRSTASFLVQKSVSSPHLLDHLHTSPPPYSKHPTPVPVSFSVQSSPHMNSDTEDDDRDDHDAMIYTSRLGSTARSASSSSQSLRSRIFGLASTSTNASRVRDKPICTTPGMLCAGETETETDEPSRHLPTARIIPSSGPLYPPNTLEQRLTPLLFEFSRLLSIVPAVFGTLYNLYHIFYPPTYDARTNVRPPPERVDYFISALWAMLTGYQCLALATGLLTRWRVYYPPLSTLVRLLALQGICWPATHLTLSILESEKRPVICWAVIATTTCMSRSVQIWVTSNLWWEKNGIGESHASTSVNGNANGGEPSASGTSPMPTPTPRYWNPKRWPKLKPNVGGGKWGGRRWDWKEVGIKCVLPAGIVYFIMAWVEVLRREFELGSRGVL